MAQRVTFLTSTSIALFALTAPHLTPARAQTVEEAETATSGEAIEEVVVTGTFIRRRSQANTASPISIIGGEDLSKIGASTVADVVQTLTINSGSQNNPDAFTQNNTTGTSNFNLRGLGVASTLVLVNGHRQVVTGVTTNDGVSFVDTSSLVPLIAVERIEILEDGAAALYGSDAVAGVVNFITHDRFEGFKLQAETNIQADEGSQEDYIVQGMGGIGWDHGHAVAAVSYTDRTPLTTAERRLSRPQDDTSSLGNPGAFFTGLPIAAGPTLPDGSVPVIPANTPLIDPTGCAEFGGIPLPAGGEIIPTPVGDIGFCGFDFGEFFNLVPDESRLNAFTKVTYDLTDRIELVGEFSYARNRASRGNSPTFPILTLPGVLPTTPGNPFAALTGISGGTFIPADPASANPFDAVNRVVGGTPVTGVPVAFFGRAIGNGGEPSENRTASDTYRFHTGISGDFGVSWSYDVSFTRAINDFTVITRDVIADAFQSALVGLGGTNCDPLTGTPGEGPCDFFNPFATSFTTNPNSQDVLDSILANQVIDADSNLSVVDAVVTGDLFEGPGGPVGIALGFQYRDETLAQDYDEVSNQDAFAFLIGNPDFRATRDVYAFFGELAVPITSRLELSAALRFEDYGGTIGDTLDPKVSLIWTPQDWVTLRGSFATSFRAPSLFQTNGTSTTLQQVEDPLNGAPAFVAVRATAAGDGLQPEQSDAYNVGATFEPLTGLTVNFDYWRFEFSDAIIIENQQAVLDAFPQDPDRVIRAGDPLTGPVLQINTNFVNASSIETDGFDFAVRYDVETDWGLFTPSAEGTYVLNYDIVDPQAGAIEGAGNRNFTNFGSPTPEWRFNIGLNWAKGYSSANAYVRYIDSVTDDQNPGRTVGSFTTLDVQYNLGLGGVSDALENTQVTIGALNVTGEEPPQVFTNGGYESRLHDPRGRVVYLRLVQTF